MTESKLFHYSQKRVFLKLFPEVVLLVDSPGRSVFSPLWHLAESLVHLVFLPGAAAAMAPGDLLIFREQDLEISKGQNSYKETKNS